jgi:hypothetical protein
MYLQGLSLWLVLLLPFVLLSYAIFLAMENRKPTYKALVPRTIIVAVAGIAALGFCFYVPIKANSAGTFPTGGTVTAGEAGTSGVTNAASLAGNYSDPTKGATLTLTAAPPPSEAGWVSFGNGTMVIHSTQNPADNIMAACRIVSFPAAGLVDNLNTGRDQVLEFKVMPETNRRKKAAWNTNQIFRLRVRVIGNVLTILPLNGDESDARRVHHFVKS